MATTDARVPGLSPAAERGALDDAGRAPALDHLDRWLAPAAERRGRTAEAGRDALRAGLLALLDDPAMSLPEGAG